MVALAVSLSRPLAAMGPIRNREQHQLVITNMALGSFGFELEEYPVGQLPLKEASPVAQALERTRILHVDLSVLDSDRANIIKIFQDLCVRL